MQSKNISSNDEPRPNGIGPGDRLQAARTEQGLSIEDVANRMHLSVNILESIEENNFDEITAPIFVKGYLRAYARIVSLSEEEMIQQYIEFYSDEDPPINSTSNTSPEISADDARVKWTTYIVILVLGGLLAAWWWNTNQDRSDAVSLDVEQSKVSNAEPAVDNALVIQEQPEIVAASESSVESPVAPATESVVEPDVEAIPVETIVSSEAEVELPVAAGEPVETEITPVVAENQFSNAEIAATVSRSAPSGADIIELTVHADTWADIKDAGGHRLAYDLIRADSELTLTGQAPFSVFFGNGHGVEMAYNGVEVDVSRYIQNDNTARLKIGNN